MMCMRHGHRPQASVLIADRDRNSAQPLTSIMHRAGFTTAVSFYGKEAVKKAKNFGPDLLLTEAHPGRLSGIHAVVLITDALLDYKLLFLSCEASNAGIARGTPAGPLYSYVPKPIRPLDFLNAIAYLLSAEWCTSDSAAEHITPQAKPLKRAGAARGNCGGDTKPCCRRHASAGVTLVRPHETGNG